MTLVCPAIFGKSLVWQYCSKYLCQLEGIFFRLTLTLFVCFTKEFLFIFNVRKQLKKRTEIARITYKCVSDKYCFIIKLFATAEKSAIMETVSSTSSNSSHQKQHLALRVALDTMKDRCILQQKRLSEVEEENQQLRERATQKTKGNGTATHNAGGVAENFQLRLQVSELQRQNLQLNAHINMVSTENRKLWQRLSQIAKEPNKPVRDADVTLTNISADSPNDEVVSARSVTANQNLIRSKTFTQHSPNPNLRHKLLSADNDTANDMLDVSLETDVALEVFAGDSGKQQFVADTDSSVSHVAMRFGFLNVDDSSANASTQEQDFNIEARKCMEGLQEMRREALKQQQELNSVFALLESRIGKCGSRFYCCHLITNRI